jgi:hypothetical protein
MSYVTLFTIPKAFTEPHVSLIQRNALASWQRLAPAVQVLVMGDDPGVAEAAVEFGATHVGDVAKNEFGTPLLDSAFREAARRGSGEILCYSNADIVLFADVLDAVRRLPLDPYLAICRRWDCDVNVPLSEIAAADSDQSLRAWAHERGTLDGGLGSDLFVFRKDTDFGLPPFAVGRAGWDNWMMGRALELKLPLIDLTPSVTAIHQNHGYRHVAGGAGSTSDGPEADRNRQLVAGFALYAHTPYNATLILTTRGLRHAVSRKHLRARLHAFVALRPVAAPLRRLIGLGRTDH